MSISHDKASQLIHADLDGTLSPGDRAELDRHLSGCAQCRAERQRMASLDRRLSTSLHGHWPRKTVTLAELNKIAEKVEAGSKGRSPIFNVGAGWLRSTAQYAAIAVAMAVMAWMLGAISGGLNLDAWPATETPTPEPGSTQTSDPNSTFVPAMMTPSATPEECRVAAYTTLDVWAGPGEEYGLMGTIPTGTELTVFGRASDVNQVTWLQISADEFPSGWVSWDASQAGDILESCPSVPIVDVGTLSPTTTPVPPPGDTLTPEPPTATLTPEPPTATLTPTPTTATVTAAPADDGIVVGCSQAVVNGTVSMPAPYVRITVTLASNLLNQLAETIAEVRTDGSFTATLTYSAQPEGTRLIVAVGEWDGANYLEPATMTGKDCAGP